MPKIQGRLGKIIQERSGIWYCQCPVAAKPGVKSWTDLSLAGTPSTHSPGHFLIWLFNLISSLNPLFWRECVLSRSVVSDSLQLWTVARRAPLSMGFSRQECWSGLPCPPPGGSSHSGIKPTSLVSCIGRHVLYHWCHLRSPCVLTSCKSSYSISRMCYLQLSYTVLIDTHSRFLEVTPKVTFTQCDTFYHLLTSTSTLYF